MQRVETALEGAGTLAPFSKTEQHESARGVIDELFFCGSDIQNKSHFKLPLMNNLVHVVVGTATRLLCLKLGRVVNP